MDFFTDEMRRDPFPIYNHLRSTSPVFHVPPPFDAWLLFDNDSVKQALTDHLTFSSAVPAPKHWFIFSDPPSHTKLRSLISKAFTPRVIANLEPRIRELSRELLDAVVERGEMDLTTDYAVPLPMKVIAGMIGIPPSDWALFKNWSDGIMKLSYSRSGPAEQAMAMKSFHEATAEMGPYVADMIAQRRGTEGQVSAPGVPPDDLLTRLIEAEVEGQRLSPEEILGFFQLLIIAGQETTSNLITNAILSLLEHPDQLELLRQSPALLPSAIEETLRFRSPLQWMMRAPRRDVELHGQTIPAGNLVLPMIGSANRDPKHFPNPDRFDIRREPNPHLAFGHGIHSCLGAALARMEAKIALTDLLERLPNLQLASTGPWPPRKALQVHSPEHLTIRFGF